MSNNVVVYQPPRPTLAQRVGSGFSSIFSALNGARLYIWNWLVELVTKTLLLILDILIHLGGSSLHEIRHLTQQTTNQRLNELMIHKSVRTHALIGTGVLMIALVATTSMNVFMQQSGHADVALEIGIGVGLIYAIVDMILIRSTATAYAVLQGSSAFKKLLAIIPRIGLAIAMSLLINGPLEAWLVGSVIDRKIEKRNEAEIAAVHAAHFPLIVKKEKEIDSWNDQVKTAQQAVRDEMDKSIGGRKADFGRVAKEKDRLAKEAEATRDEKVAVIKQEIAAIWATVKEKEREIKTRVRGVVERLDILAEIKLESVTVNSWSILISLVLILMELSPLLAKLLMRSPIDLVSATESRAYKAEVEGQADQKVRRVQMEALALEARQLGASRVELLDD